MTVFGAFATAPGSFMVRPSGHLRLVCLFSCCKVVALVEIMGLGFAVSMLELLVYSVTWS